MGHDAIKLEDLKVDVKKNYEDTITLKITSPSYCFYSNDINVTGFKIETTEIFRKDKIIQCFGVTIYSKNKPERGEIFMFITGTSEDIYNKLKVLE